MRRFSSPFAIAVAAAGIRICSGGSSGCGGGSGQPGRVPERKYTVAPVVQFDKAAAIAIPPPYEGDAPTATQFDGIATRLDAIHGALPTEGESSFVRPAVTLLVYHLRNNSDACHIDATIAAAEIVLWGDFRGHPRRRELIGALFDIKKVLRPVRRCFAVVYEHLVDDFARVDRPVATGLTALMDLLCGADVPEKQIRDQVDACRKTQDDSIRQHLDTVVQELRPRDPLDGLAAHIEVNPAAAKHFRRHYDALFHGLPLSRRRAVFFFHNWDLADFEGRHVPVRFEPSLVPAAQAESPTKLTVVTGPSGCGKTCSGVLGLATPAQLLVFVGRPPSLVSEETHSEEQKVSLRSELTDTVRDCVDEAQHHEARRDGLQDPQEKEDAHLAARRCYKKALCERILATLEKRLGKRVDVRDDNAVEVVFFFDELGSRSRNSDIVRLAACDIARDGPGGDFGRTLRADFGLELASIAMAGTGLDVEVAVGSLKAESARLRVVTPNTAALQWADFIATSPKAGDVPAHVEAELDAVLRLPRLAALVRATAGYGSVPSKQRLFRCLPVAVDRFADLNRLEQLVGDEAERRKVGLQCLRSLLFSTPVVSDESLDGGTRALIAGYGVAVLENKSGECCHKVAIGPGQRLLLRRFFALTQHAATGDGFDLAVADFLGLAAIASDGKTVAEFIAALNTFFSHSATRVHAQAAHGGSPC